MSAGRWTVETRAAGGAWTPYSSPECILARGLTERAAKRLVTRLRKTEASGPDGDLEYRAREAGGPSQPESDRSARVVSLRLAPATLTALDALATRWGLSRSATVARLAVNHAIPVDNHPPVTVTVARLSDGEYVRGPSPFGKLLAK